MKEGSEPMRAFSDLAQFLDKSRNDGKSQQEANDNSVEKKNEKDTPNAKNE